MSSPAKNERPLSPHLQIYRLPLTALISITHRVTGAALTFGLMFLAVCLMVASEGPERYAMLQQVLQSWLGQLILWAWVLALLFHLCHGIRHLVWDTGYGLDRAVLNRHSLIELSCTAVLAAIVFFLS